MRFLHLAGKWECDSIRLAEKLERKSFNLAGAVLDLPADDRAGGGLQGGGGPGGGGGGGGGQGDQLGRLLHCHQWYHARSDRRAGSVSSYKP